MDCRQTIIVQQRLSMIAVNHNLLQSTKIRSLRGGWLTGGHSILVNNGASRLTDAELSQYWSDAGRLKRQIAQLVYVRCESARASVCGIECEACKPAR